MVNRLTKYTPDFQLRSRTGRDESDGRAASVCRKSASTSASAFIAIAIGLTATIAKADFYSSDYSVVNAHIDYCDIFVGRNDFGHYVFRWMSGYMPAVNDNVVGRVQNIGVTTVRYPDRDASGQILIEEFVTVGEMTLDKMEKYCLESIHVLKTDGLHDQAFDD